nr:unnamed protein product [Digitaria exilis]
MPPQATSSTVLIIVLILNTLPAPTPQPWAPVANTQETAYQINDISSDYDPFAGHRSSWLPPMDIRSGHFGIANTTEPSVLLLLLVSLPSRHDQPAMDFLHYGSNNTKVNDRLLFWCTRSSFDSERPIQPADLCPCGPRWFSHRELAAATSGFSDERKIGRGGFGPVYRGFLRDQGCDAAIKLHQYPIILNVYALIPRYKIALGVGSAILYLHTECDHLVLHGDIKPANILLDGSCNAKLGDFGLARLIDHGSDSTSPTTQVVAGTPGYMDPELVTNQRPCPESDVFSFGVVLLEIACGRRPTTAQPTGTPVLLLNWVRDMYCKNSLLGVADRRLDGEFDGWQMRRVLVVGLWCTHQEQSERPSIAQAMALLRREDAELPVLDLVAHDPDAVRSLEEIAYGDLSEGGSASEGSSTDTAYHTSTDSTCLLE